MRRPGHDGLDRRGIRLQGRVGGTCHALPDKGLHGTPLLRRDINRQPKIMKAQHIEEENAPAALVSHSMIRIQGDQDGDSAVHACSSQARMRLQWGGILMTVRSAEAIQGVLEGFSAARKRRRSSPLLDAKASASHPGELRVRVKTIHPIRTRWLSVVEADTGSTETTLASCAARDSAGSVGPQRRNERRAETACHTIKPRNRANTPLRPTTQRRRTSSNLFTRRNHHDRPNHYD
jgi:hypothetical protein